MDRKCLYATDSLICAADGKPCCTEGCDGYKADCSPDDPCFDKDCPECEGGPPPCA